MTAVMEQVYAQLGGDDSTGAEIGSELEMDQLLRHGLPITVLKEFRENWGFTVMELATSLAIPKSTLMRMLDQQKRMSAADSDRVYRLASLLALAEACIGDRKTAGFWLRQPNKALGDQTPLRALETVIGARHVEQVLGRIAYGGVS